MCVCVRMSVCVCACVNGYHSVPATHTRSLKLSKSFSESIQLVKQRTAAGGGGQGEKYVD